MTRMLGERLTRASMRMMCFSMVVILIAGLTGACSNARGPVGDIQKPPGAGPNEIDFQNPIGGVSVAQTALGGILPFHAVVPPVDPFGSPSDILASPNSVPAADRQVVFQYQTDPYGLVDVSESLNEVKDWNRFVSQWADRTPTPGITIIGSAERFDLPDGSVALITTDESGSLSDIQWLNPGGNIEFGIAGPALDKSAVQALSTAMVKSYTTVP